MSTVNELCFKIDDLNKKLEEEPRKIRKRKLIIKDKIRILEEEKKRSGLRGDTLSVQKFNTQIKKLKYESVGGKRDEYKSEIKVLKYELLNLIVEYHEKGHDIEDIFQIENVSQYIQDEWLNKCNFGKTTGFLFVDEINDENEYNWRYFNPIFDIEYKSKNLEDLEHQITSDEEVFLIFNNNLANKSKNRELKLYQIKIDAYISELNDCEDISNILNSLKEFGDKFNEKEIISIYEFLLEDNDNYKLIVDFNDILEVNLNKLDNTTLDKIYQDIIDAGLNQLNNEKDNNKDILGCLKEFANTFSEKQIISLYNFFIKKIENYKYFHDINYILNNYEDKILNKIYQCIIDDGIKKFDEENSYYLRYVVTCLENCSDYFSKSQIISLYESLDNYQYYRDFYYILDKNIDKFDETFLNNLYNEIINKGINELENSKYSSNYQIFYCFKPISDKFSKNQIKRLYDYILENISDIDNFNTIFESNLDKFDQKFIDEIYSGLIDNGINKLKSLYLTNDERYKLFTYLNLYSSEFTPNQLNRLCDIVINDECCFNEDFLLILEDNGRVDDEFYKNIINNRIKILKELDSKNNTSKYIIKDLKYLADKFSKIQIDKLTEVIISNTKICNYANDFEYILRINDEEDDEIYEKIIDSRIACLNNIDSRPYSCLFKDLDVFAYNFNENQLKALAKFIEDKTYLSCCGNDILNILFKNRNSFDDNIDEKIIEMRINLELNELNNISFDYRKARLILERLYNYSDNFNKSQLIRLCDISISNDQVYNCIYCKSSLRHILSENKDKIDKELYEKTFSINNL